MVSGKIVQYVMDKLKENASEEEIKEKLGDIGISAKSIEQALIKAGKGKKIKVKEDKPASPEEQLRDYIIREINKSVPLESIGGALLKNGWRNDQIQPIFDSLKIMTRPTEGVSIRTNEIDDVMKRNDIKILDKYDFKFMDINVKIVVYSEKAKPTTTYHMIMPAISDTTHLILEEIRLKLIDQVNLSTFDISEGDYDKLDEKIKLLLKKLLIESFPHIDVATQKFLISYLISRILGLGVVQIIKADENLEEIVINSSDEPIYVYHKTWGWCLTNQFLKNQDEIIHIASMTGRKIGREITTLTPLLDAHLPNGDRINATLKPVTAYSPTITIRKFSNDPWTITKFLQTRTMDYNTAALIWLAIHYELSALVVGGTASGKTSCLNVLTSLIPPNQRVISIEDTREIRLPKYMHWVPMVSRAPNPEGKGGIEMEDLLVNSLRMRPDRIIVGEVRKKEQAETLFEAIHTGHSVYATFHANDARETIIRLTNPPVSVPKSMMPAISLLIVQFRNRRSGLRRTFQLAEITREGDSNVLFQYNAKTDSSQPLNQSKTLFETLKLYTGSTMEEINQMLADKLKVLQYLVRHNLSTIEDVGKVMSSYYTDHDLFFKNYILPNRKIE